MPEVAKKKRIFQIAKELNISHLEIMQFLVNNGSPVDSHMAPVKSEVYDEILLEFSKDKLQIERHRKEQARKVVVSKIQQAQPEEIKPSSITPQTPVRKLKTSLKDEKLALSDKLKIASSDLLKNKEIATPIDKKTSYFPIPIVKNNLAGGALPLFSAAFLFFSESFVLMLNFQLSFAFIILPNTA